MDTTNKNYIVDSFPSGPNREGDRRAIARIIEIIHNESKYFFLGAGCFKGTFTLQVKDGSKSYQATPKMHYLYIVKGIQGRIRVNANTKHNSTIRS